MTLSAGELVEGRYVVEGTLGSGGMADVWAVRHVHLGTSHALKVLHQTSPELRERLVEEGRLQARLTHPCIVRVTDVVVLLGGLGLIMDRIDGPSLRALLDRGRLPLAQAVALGAAMLAGVAHAHSQGFIHRDLKPDNILMEPTGDGGWQPRITDFGLAKARTPDGPTRTRTGVGMGTPGYMPPEQYRDVAGVGPAADVFALGCIFYELLTGRRPYDGRDVITLFQQASSRGYPSPRSLDASLPGTLSELLTRCLEPDPARRFEDAEALAAAWPASPPSKEPSAAPLPAPPAAPPAPVADTFDVLSIEHRADETPLPRQGAPLPPAGDTFVGRVDELAAIAALFSEGHLLVTLLGPGGMGKTRIALEYARAAGDRFGDAWFCDLSEARTLEQLCRVVSVTLDAPLGSGDPVATLADAIAARGRSLIILDNCEQLIEDAARAVQRWREQGEAAFLVTSRSPLDLPREQRVLLRPLSPEHAIDLFVRRARARDAAFASSAGDATALAALVELLDGLPLALELAAARAGLMAPATMVSRMNQRFRLLSAGRRGAQRRQATLRGAIDWSWALLEDWEQAAFAQSSVFQGGFTLDAAEEVLDLSGFDGAPWPMDAVQSLLDKSLLRTVAPTSAGTKRFGMYLSLYEYAVEKYAALPADRQARLRARHGRHYAGLSTPEARATLHHHGGVERWWALCVELDNLFAAARRALADGQLETAATAALGAAEVLERQGPYSAGIELLEDVRAAAEAAGARSSELAEAYRELGFLRMLQREHALAEPHFEAALDMHRSIGDQQGEGNTLLNLGNLRLSLKQPEEALELYEASLSKHRATGNRRREGLVLSLLGLVQTQRGETGAGWRLYEEALAIHREVGDQLGVGIVLGYMARARSAAGRPDEALALFEEAAGHKRQVGDLMSEGIDRASMGAILERSGRVAEALTHYQTAHRCFRRSHNSARADRVQARIATLGEAARSD